jgi:glutamyl-tRNA synthetase
MIGRFAPSPTGALHLGNLRTALVAYASVRARGGTFLIRFEDLDMHNANMANAQQQIDDLASIGIVADETPVVQSERFALYHEAIQQLTDQGLTYECFCTRKEILEAAQAPHGGQVMYPGTCRDLTENELAQRREARPGALRLRASGATETFADLIHGTVTGPVDDVVLRRNDGVPSYNIAVVVDDALQGVTEVVRGDDLLEVTSNQVHLQKLLGYSTPVYGHVPLVVGDDGERLAKRHGAVTLADLDAQGMSATQVKQMLWASLGQEGDTFSWDGVPRQPWVPPLTHGKS